MARYGQEFKDRAVARLLPPESAAVEVVAREIGVGVSTLERWRADALSMPARERTWTAPARFDAVLTTAAMDEASRNAWCREHGVYPQELQRWRQAANQALADPEEVRASPQQTKQDRRRILELERELRRKDKALAETAALLVLSKNLWSPSFLQPEILGVVVGLLQSIRRQYGETNLRATMRVAPGSPKKSLGSKSQFLIRLSFRPLCRSRHPISTVAKPRLVNRYCLPDADHGATGAASVRYSVCREASAQTVRASLFASAQATTLECRRVSIERTQSASSPFCLSRRCM